jgi:L-ascorbate metabolism protein UlaG (beta-lactamase superfamily)
MMIQWLGHASFKIKAAGKTIYIDPYAGEPSFYSEKADIILVSHSHFDHCDGQKIKMIRGDNTAFYGPEDIVGRFGSVKIEAGQSVIVEDVKIEAVKAYNIGKDFHKEGFAVGFVIKAEGKAVYFAGDTDLIPEMGIITADIALLPVGGTYTMNAEEAAEAAEKVKAKIAIPMHYGYGIVGKEYDAEDFKELCERKEIKVKIMKQGEETEV